MKLSYEEEMLLRARARDDAAEREVLVDYYKEQGQPSRAKLWQEASVPLEPLATLFVREVGWPDPDLHPYSFDRRACPPRNILIWMCRNHETATRVAKLVGITKSRIGEIARRIEGQIAYAAIKEQRAPTMAATKRLMAAGALGVIDPRGSWYVELPPEDWPLCGS